VSERDGLEGSLAKFGLSNCFVRFANVPDSKGKGESYNVYFN